MHPALTTALVVALLAVSIIALFAWRLRAIAGRVGSFECALRSGSHWHPGIAAYTREELVWYEVVSLSRRPRHRWDRYGLAIVERTLSTRDGRPVVQARFSHHGHSLVLAAAPAAFEGVVSWLEAAPPGAQHGHLI